MLHRRASPRVGELSQRMQALLLQVLGSAPVLRPRPHNLSWTLMRFMGVFLCVVRRHMLEESAVGPHPDMQPGTYSVPHHTRCRYLVKLQDQLLDHHRDSHKLRRSVPWV